MAKILIIKLGSLGDIVQISGAIRDISENHKNDEIVSLEDLRLLDSTNLNYKIF